MLLSSLTSSDEEPTSYTSASKEPKWREAMSEEFHALLRNGTWKLVPYHSSMNLVGNKWVYRIKRNSDGSISRYKARLVAKGFHQREGIDYFDIFSATDPSLFIFKQGGVLLYCLIYVDDILVTSNSPAYESKLLTSLASEFSIKDLGPLHFFLGIEATPHGNGLLLSQNRYIQDLLTRAGMTDCKPILTPMSTTSTDSGGALMTDPTKYRSIVGALQYVTLTRPDVSFAVNRVCQFMHSPTEDHWTQVKRILRYLKGTSTLGLFLEKSHNPTLQAFSDADWAGNSSDRRSTGGFAIFLGPNLLSWTSRKQKTVARSSTESEYKALADATAELIWLEALFKELHCPIRSSPILWCDNLGATYLTANPVFHARTKHIEIDFHFVRERVASRNLSVQFISTADQLADIFTKALPTARFQFMRDKLKVRQVSPST
ncbi:uncharacterized mitochondrial protein AtMg00810-like [Telopea speciosissima]|uniref:uncharacterized mitochondrial protein AtMg00810-like n=1 Tax=Telopea speciosissima TaxID=54955 RepID=UPI001CC371F7|nr:uncharacterized mitochondrial protein AtMg00810-like [Telopea speciosissima]